MKYQDKKSTRIVFDLDDTLWKVDYELKCQVPDYDLINVLRWFYNNGDIIFVWSAGGVGYCQQIVDKLGLTNMVKVIPKLKDASEKNDIDISFDDETINNAKVNIKVKRPDYRELDKEV